MRWMTRAAFGLVVLLVAVLAHAEDWTGKCVGVTDGDTIAVMHNGVAEKIRLDGIDAPESHQAYGTQAKNTLSSLVSGKVVLVKDHGKDRYGRTLATITDTAKNWNVNAMMVRNGFAWHYKQYSKDQKLAECETLARQAKLGLWRDPNPVPPWDFRRGITTAAAAASSTSTQPIAPKPTPQVQATTEPQNQTVYITNSGTKYHQAGCRYLSKSSHPVALAQVTGRYQPCSVCNPPVAADVAPPAAVPYALPYARAPSAQAPTSPPAYSAPAYQTQQQPQSATVYVTRTGAKYHRAGCRYLSKSSIPMPLSQAAQRYTPCSVCSPPKM